MELNAIAKYHLSESLPKLLLPFSAAMNMTYQFRKSLEGIPIDFRKEKVA